MKAIVIKPFRGLPDRETTVRDFVVGDEVHGDLAAVALREGWARDEGGDKAAAPAPAPAPAPATKTVKGGKASKKPEPEPDPDADAGDDDGGEGE